MTYDEAKHLLHASCSPLEPHGELLAADEGFLPSLRPYRDHLVEKNFHLVMEALLTVGETLRKPQVDREVMNSLWIICTWGRMWGLHPKGMLRRNDLIGPAEIERLECWIDIIEQTVQRLLGGTSLPQCINEYAEYVVKVGWWDNIEFFVALMDRALSDPELFPGEWTVLALERLGARARPVLPTLYALLARQYEFGPRVHNPKAWIENTHNQIWRAIQQIEAAPNPE